MHSIVNVLLLIVLMALISACDTSELTFSDCDNPALSNRADCQQQEPRNITGNITSDVPPTAPTILITLVKTDDSIHVTWIDTATNEQNVMIERSDYPDSGYEVIATLGENATGYQDNSLSASTNYCYRVKASNTAGESAYSHSLCETTNAVPLLAPDVPTEFTVTASKTRLNFVLTWKAVTNESDYEIERSIDTPTSFTPIVTLNAGAQTYIDTKDLNKETQYWYRLRATNAAGESAYTSSLSGISAGLDISLLDRPPTPQNFEVVASVTDLVTTVTWYDGQSETEYEIQYSTSQTGPFDTSIFATQDVAQLTVDLPNSETSYYFRMRAINDIGNSDFTDVKKIHSAQGAHAVASMQLVTGLNAISVALNWDMSSNAEHYRIERSLSVDADFSMIKDWIPNTQNTYVDTDRLNLGATYYYRIFSVNDIGENSLQDKIVLPQERLQSKAPFSYKGWTVGNGEIDIYASSESVCGPSVTYDPDLYACSILDQDNGFIQFQVTPPVNRAYPYINYLMTIFTNQNANGDTDSLDYYHVNTMEILLSLSPSNTNISIVHSERKGLPAPLLSPNNPGKTQLYHGEITGVFISEYNALTGLTTALPQTDTFTIKFTYDANATELSEHRWFGLDKPIGINGYFSDSTSYIAMHPAITALEIARGDQSWTANMGYVNSYNRTMYVYQYDLGNISKFGFDNYFITAYADPSESGNENRDEFFGMDFHGYGEFSDIIANTYPLPKETHDITNPPASDDFNRMGISLYFNDGNIILTGTPTSFNVISIDAPPSAPENISTTTNMDGLSAKFSWESGVSILNYRVERSTAVNGPYTDISDLLAGNITAYEDTDLMPGTLYYYRIYAINEFGESFVEITLSTPNTPT